jgi:hypothetical protein
VRRRAFITALGSAAAGPVVARSQRRSVPLVAFLSPRTDETNIGAFQRGLCELGDIEGQNITPETRPADGDNARLPALAWQPASTRYRGTIAGPDGHVGPDLAGDLVRRQAAVIFATGGPPAIRAGMAATKTIPIVFTVGADPVQQGLVASLGRPGGLRMLVGVLNASALNWSPSCC